MSGPLPKPSALRQRQNKTSTRATLSAGDDNHRVPALPKREGDWHPLTRAFWRDVWHSPMAAEFLQADKHGLYLLAELVDGFWRKPSTTLAAEIRQHRMAFGLTPIDRRRLQWEVERAESAARKHKAPSERKRKASGDPRDYLVAVK